MSGFLSIVLHAHLPYVRHPEYEEFLEEDWLYEAITETYIPILKMFDNLKNDKVDFNITMTISGTLANMLNDPLLQNRYIKHLDKMIEFCQLELNRLKEYPDMHKVALHNYKLYNESKEYYTRYSGNLLGRFRYYQDLGNLEIIPVTATHGMLPMMKDIPNAVRAQVRMAKLDYMKHFGREPKGIWLAECAYYNGQDSYLKEEGIRYFLVDAHGILNSNPRPIYGVYSSVYTKNGIAAFARDLESSEQVWSSEVGYPGDGDYRDVARNKAIDHAYNFVFNRSKQLEYLSSKMKYRKPIILSPYDAELYGHWWYEGPIFLEYIFRAIKDSNFGSITPSKYLDIYKVNQIVDLSMSSWGANGYFDVWVDGSNDYIYRHLHKAAEKMIEISKIETEDTLLIRALNQASRELLLAQTSCWPFIMYTKTMVGYAQKKVSDHSYRLFKLYEDIKNNSIDEEWLSEIENRDNIFSNIDYKIFR